MVAALPGIQPGLWPDTPPRPRVVGDGPAPERVVLRSSLARMHVFSAHRANASRVWVLGSLGPWGWAGGAVQVEGGAGRCSLRPIGDLDRDRRRGPGD